MVPLDHPLVLKAEAFARIAHAGQSRKWNAPGRPPDPYILHPERVATATAGHPLATPELVAAAWLHDVVEDSGVPTSVLVGEFGETVASYVLWLTNASTFEPLKSEKRAIRKAVDIAYVALAPREVRVVKLFDRIDNLTDMVGADDGFKRLYGQESLVLADKIGDVDLFLRQRIIDLATAFVS